MLWLTDLPICNLFVQIIQIFHCKFGVRSIDHSIKIRNSASDVWVVLLQDLCTASVIDAKLNFGGGNFSVHMDFALQIQGWNNYIQNFISDQEFCTNNDANRAGLLCEGRVNAPRDNLTFLVRCCLHHCWASCSYLLRSALNRTEDQIILIYFDEPRFHSSWIASTKYFRLGCFLQ